MHVLWLAFQVATFIENAVVASIRCPTNIYSIHYYINYAFVDGLLSVCHWLIRHKLPISSKQKHLAHSNHCKICLVLHNLCVKSAYNLIWLLLRSDQSKRSIAQEKNLINEHPRECSALQQCCSNRTSVMLRRKNGKDSCNLTRHKEQRNQGWWSLLLPQLLRK